LGASCPGATVSVMVLGFDRKVLAKRDKTRCWLIVRTW
jgi:hypothetical protein